MSHHRSSTVTDAVTTFLLPAPTAIKPDAQPRVYRQQRDNDAIVHDILAKSERPLSAHQISSISTALGNAITPTQAYRTLRRLIDTGHVSRIELAAGYALTDTQANGFGLCETCGRLTALSLDGLTRQVADALAEKGFTVRRQIIEASGLCAACSAVETGQPGAAAISL